MGEVAEWSKAAVLKTADRASGPGVRIPPSPPLGNKAGHASFCRSCDVSSDQRWQQVVFRSHNPDLALRNFDALGKCAKMVATITAAGKANALASDLGELVEHRRGYRLLALWL